MAIHRHALYLHLRDRNSPRLRTVIDIQLRVVVVVVVAAAAVAVAIGAVGVVVQSILWYSSHQGQMGGAVQLDFVAWWFVVIVTIERDPPHPWLLLVEVPKEEATSNLFRVVKHRQEWDAKEAVASWPR